MEDKNPSGAATKRILTIDGGGVKGTFPASFLATVEEATGKSISDYFDLIVGTSTGGIIALGLGLGWPAQDLVDFYEEYGPRIFRQASFWRRLGSVFNAKYDPEPLHRALEENFRDARIGESTVRLVIPSVNLDNGEVHLYKTAHHPRLELDYKEKAVDAARATSSAPTYFPSFISSTGVPLIDGGVWANNPMAVAVVEALTTLRWSREQIKLLSLGCTTEPFDAEEARENSRGLGYWVFNATNLFMSTQSSSAKGIAKLLLGGQDRILRINPVVPRGRFKLDNPDGIDALRGFGNSEARKALPKLKKHFLTQPVDPFEPCHEL